MINIFNNYDLDEKKNTIKRMMNRIYFIFGICFIFLICIFIFRNNIGVLVAYIINASITAALGCYIFLMFYNQIDYSKKLYRFMVELSYSDERKEIGTFIRTSSKLHMVNDVQCYAFDFKIKDSLAIIYLPNSLSRPKFKQYQDYEIVISNDIIKSCEVLS